METPLAYACGATLSKTDDTEIVRLLLDHGADINAQHLRNLGDKDDSYTALMRAALAGRAGTVRLLLGRGADVKTRMHDHTNALLCAAYHDGEGVECVRLLLDHGADVNAQDSAQRTALGIAAERGATALARLLLDRGANPNTDVPPFPRAAWGTHNPLLLAAQAGRLDCVRLLIARGAALDTEDPGRMTALMYACRGPSDAVVRFLLDGGADVNAADDGGWTPLIIAIPYKNRETIRLLLDRGAAVNVKTVTGIAPLSSAISGGDAPIEAMLRKAGAKEMGAKL